MWAGSRPGSRRSFLQRSALAVAGCALWRFGVRIPATVADEVELPGFVHRRDAWGAAPPGPGMRPHTIERVTVHHTGPPAWYGTPGPAAYLRRIQAFHMGPERGWADIAYHLLIDLDGQVWQGRPLAYAADSATAYDPAGHALVAVLGDYDVQLPNEPQIDALGDTVRWLLQAYGLDAATLGGHRDYAPTSCPGRNLYPLLGRLTDRCLGL